MTNLVCNFGSITRASIKTRQIYNKLYYYVSLSGLIKTTLKFSNVLPILRCSILSEKSENSATSYSMGEMFETSEMFQ